MSRIEDDPTLPHEDDPLFEPGEATPGVLGGRYTMEERLGAGGGAVVWRAFDEDLSRTVAVKVLRAGADDPATAVQRLRHEAATAGRVPHPGIVAVYDTGAEEGVAWLALEHVAGPTLLAVLRHHPRGLPPQVAAAVAEQAAVALGHAHARGLVHRDVKPSNLLISGDGVVKLADFGVAASAARDEGGAATARDEQAAPARPWGSRGYAAPEQLRNGPGAQRPTVDVFALGVVLHECLTGRPAFLDRTGRNGSERLLAPRQVRPDVPRALDDLVRRATAGDREQRFADGTAFAASLRSIVDRDPIDLAATLVRPGPAGTAVPATSHDGTDERQQGVPSEVDRRWVIAGLLVLAGVAGLAWLTTRPPEQPVPQAAVVADAGVPVTTVEAFDPYGSIDGVEGAPAAAVDGDPATAWRTPAYPVPLRSLGSPGVGLWLDVGEPRSIEAVELALETGGVTVELLVADQPPGPTSTEADWRSLDRLDQPGELAELEAGPETARYWLLWFTELELTGETWQASLTDLRFRPAEQ